MRAWLEARDVPSVLLESCRGLSGQDVQQLSESDFKEIGCNRFQAKGLHGAIDALSGTSFPDAMRQLAPGRGGGAAGGGDVVCNQHPASQASTQSAVDVVTATPEPQVTPTEDVPSVSPEPRETTPPTTVNIDVVNAATLALAEFQEAWNAMHLSEESFSVIETHFRCNMCMKSSNRPLRNQCDVKDVVYQWVTSHVVSKFHRQNYNGKHAEYAFKPKMEDHTKARAGVTRVLALKRYHNLNTVASIQSSEGGVRLSCTRCNSFTTKRSVYPIAVTKQLDIHVSSCKSLPHRPTDRTAPERSGKSPARKKRKVPG